MTSPPGSGTTTAYLLPLLQRLLRTPRPRTSNRAFPAALVLAPTREAAAAVAAEAAKLAAETHVKTVLLTGGTPIAKQVRKVLCCLQCQVLHAHMCVKARLLCSLLCILF